MLSRHIVGEIGRAYTAFAGVDLDGVYALGTFAAEFAVVLGAIKVILRLIQYLLMQPRIIHKLSELLLSLDLSNGSGGSIIQSSS